MNPAHCEAPSSPSEHAASQMFREQLVMVLAQRTQAGQDSYASLDSEIIRLGPASRTAYTETAAQMLSWVPSSPWHAEGAYWPAYVLKYGPKVLLEAMATLQEMGNLSAQRSSTLSLLGNLVSTGIRREILRDLLVKTNFNIKHVAELCRSSPPNVTREIRAIGLGSLYDRMRSKGFIKQGVHRKRRKVSAVPLVPCTPQESP